MLKIFYYATGDIAMSAQLRGDSDEKFLSLPYDTLWT